jgi:DNA-binding transcriptional regulator YiaG
MPSSYISIWYILRWNATSAPTLLELALTSTRSPRYRHFLKRLRQARLDSGLTQVQVAERLKQPQPYVSKCESGERRIDVVELKALAEIYGRPLDWFLS